MEIINSVHHIHQGLNINVLGGCNRLFKVICLFSFQTRVSRRQFVLLLKQICIIEKNISVCVNKIFFKVLRMMYDFMSYHKGPSDIP